MTRPGQDQAHGVLASWRNSLAGQHGGGHVLGPGPPEATGRPGPDEAALRLRLDRYYAAVSSIILARQHPVTGLLPASTSVNAHGDYTHAWVRDNVYSVLAAWGLGLAYRRLDADMGRAYVLEQSTVKLMRGLLLAMMRQAGKIERFKATQDPVDALHAKYDTATGQPVVGDEDWGHLQLDATSLFLLMLAQMTASGLRVVFTVAEVNLVQNLVHYIGRAYRTPDYGIWERGAKINHGIRELNASSVGMAKAALEALAGFNVFGPEGGQDGIVHVVPDEIARARITLASLLPRESDSKEIDAALLGIIGFPAFAMEDAELVRRTEEEIVTKLKGRYGFKRFLLDGHQTVLEDHSRLHYNPSELGKFENIESEWPLFFAYQLVNLQFAGRHAEADAQWSQLQEVMVEVDGWRLLPELYYVPEPLVSAERASPHSQRRLPNDNLPLVWAQSLYFLGAMLRDGLLSPRDVDPLGRFQRIGHQPARRVQLALLARDTGVKQALEAAGIRAETLAEATAAERGSPRVGAIEVQAPDELARAFGELGKNSALGLSGRAFRRLRSLSTARLYLLGGRRVLFLPQMLSRDFYLSIDNQLLSQQIIHEIAYIQRHWDQPGQPLLLLLVEPGMVCGEGSDQFLDGLRQLSDDAVEGLRVRVGRLAHLLPQAPRERIDELHGFALHPDALAAFAPHAPAEAQPAESGEPMHGTYERATLCHELPLAELQEQLQARPGPLERMELLAALSRRVGLDAESGMPGPEEGTLSVRQALEALYVEAADRRLWPVIRRTAGLLGRQHSGLEDAVTEILIRQRQLAVGRAYSERTLIRSPLDNQRIMAIIEGYCGGDEREAALTQELVLYLGMLIRAEPELFDDLLTLRAGHLLLLLTSEVARELGSGVDQAFDAVLGLAPSAILARLRTLLGAYRTVEANLFRLEALASRTPSGELTRVAFPETGDPALEGAPDWLVWRQQMGAVGRVPSQFYPRLRTLLATCTGVVIGDKLNVKNRLDSPVLLADTTPLEKGFALRVEQLLNDIEHPEYRQLTIEALMTLISVAEGNPDLVLDSDIVLDVVIGHAVRLAWISAHPASAPLYDAYKASAWRHFYHLPPHAVGNALVRAFTFLVELGEQANVEQLA